MIEIDGSYGEGGGQVLRTALTLSALTGRPARIRRIRAGRRNPGLAPQHLTGVLALAAICDAEVRGAAIGSAEVEFHPRSAPRAGEYTFDVSDAAQGGSAGSVTLIFQTLLLPLARMGIHAETQLDAWGFYPVGEKGKPSERVADEACLDLLAHRASGQAVDMHLADQLLLPMALARGHSALQTCRVTQHLLTNAHIIRQFLGAKIEITGAEGESGAVSISGAPPPTAH